MKSCLSAIMLIVTLSISVAGAAGEVSLQELQSRLSFYTGIKAFETRFEQVKLIRSLSVRLKSKGILTVKKPHSVIWKITEPSAMTVKINEKTMVIANDKEAEQQVVDLNEVPSAMKSLAMLTTWLKLDPVELNKNYVIHKNSNHEFIFEPRVETASIFTSFAMTISAEGHLKKLTLNEKSKDSLEITFSKPKVLKEAP